jgi:hypothetical protein
VKYSAGEYPPEVLRVKPFCHRVRLSSLAIYPYQAAGISDVTIAVQGILRASFALSTCCCGLKMAVYFQLNMTVQTAEVNTANPVFVISNLSRPEICLKYRKTDL